MATTTTLSMGDRIRSGLARPLEEQRITELDALTYLLYYDAICEKPDLVRSFVLAAYKKDGLFPDIANEYERDEASRADADRLDSVRKHLVS